MLNLIADTLPQTVVAAQQEQFGWMLIAVIIGGIITVSWLTAAQPETRYHYQPGKQVPTAPTKRPAAKPDKACNCAWCCSCDQNSTGDVKVPPVLLAFGGLGSLPVYATDPDDEDPDVGVAEQSHEASQGFPDWLATDNCAACGIENDAVCFLCQTCQLLSPAHRIDLVFELNAAGDVGEAWEMAEAIIRDVRKHRAAVVNDGQRIAYSKN